MTSKKSPFLAAKNVDFLLYGTRLKQVPRSGWFLKGIEHPESVSDHCYGTTLVALLLARAEGLDERKVLLTAMVHDLSEAITGDIIWEAGATSNKKKQLKKHIDENEAASIIFDIIGYDEAKRLFVDFLEQRTPEARLVKDADKLDMIMQALEYEKDVSNPATLLEFWENTAKYLQSETAWAIFEELKRRSKIMSLLPNRPVRKDA